MTDYALKVGIHKRKEYNNRMVKIIIIIAFIAVIFSLGNALFHLVKHEERSKKTVNALTFRIGLSILLFIFLFIATATGLITPHGIGSRIHQQSENGQKAPSNKDFSTGQKKALP
jgi:flagellar basal body-associated protein FliL